MRLAIPPFTGIFCLCLSFLRVSLCAYLRTSASGGPVAQWTEHRISNPTVAGSNPAGLAKTNRGSQSATPSRFPKITTKSYFFCQSPQKGELERTAHYPRRDCKVEQEKNEVLPPQLGTEKESFICFVSSLN